MLRVLVCFVVLFILTACGTSPPSTPIRSAATIPPSGADFPASTRAVVPLPPAPAVATEPPVPKPPTPVPTPVPPTQAPAPVPTATPAGPVVYHVGDAVVLGRKRITLHSAAWSTGTPYLKPAVGARFLLIDLTIEDISQDPVTVSTLMEMILKDDTGQAYNISISAQSASGKAGPGGTIAPGDKNRGTVGFEVPAAATGLQFRFDNVFDNEHARWALAPK